MAAQYCIQKLGPYEPGLNLLSADKDALKHSISDPLKWIAPAVVVDELCENLKQYKETTNMIKITNLQRTHMNDDCATKLSE